MKRLTGKFSRQHLTWLIIVIMAALAVLLRIAFADQPVQTAQEPTRPMYQPTPTADQTQLVAEIYANANRTLTAIYRDTTAIFTPTILIPAESAQKPTGKASALVEQVQPGPDTLQSTLSPASSLTRVMQNSAQPAATATPDSVTGSETPELLETASPTLAPSDTPTQSPSLLPSPTSGSCSYQTNSVFETSLLVLINELRASSGNIPLAVEENVEQVAFLHSEDMACQDFYDHIGSNGSTFLERLNNANISNYARATELLYVGRGEDNSPQSAFEAWLSGTSSYSQLVYPAYNRVGIGYIYKEDSTYGGYFTLILLAVQPVVE